MTSKVSRIKRFLNDRLCWYELCEFSFSIYSPQVGTHEPFFSSKKISDWKKQRTKIDGQINGWKGGGTNERTVDGWMSRCWRNEQTDGQIMGWMDEWWNRWWDEQREGLMSGWKDVGANGRVVVGRIKRHYIAELGHYEEHSDGSNLTSVLVFEKKYIYTKGSYFGLRIILIPPCLASRFEGSGLKIILHITLLMYLYRPHCHL